MAKENAPKPRPRKQKKNVPQDRIIDRSSQHLLSNAGREYKHKDVRKLISNVYHVPDCQVFRTIEDYTKGIWIVFITPAGEDVADEYGKQVGTICAEVEDYNGKKQYLYNKNRYIEFDSKVKLFGRKNKDIAEYVRHRISIILHKERQISDKGDVFNVKLVLIDEERFARLNAELAKKITVSNYAKNIREGGK